MPIHKKLLALLFALSLNFFSLSMEIEEVKALSVPKLRLLALNCTISYMKSFDTSCIASTQKFLEYIKPLSSAQEISSQISSCVFPKANYLWKLLPYRLISEQKLRYPSESFPRDPYVGLKKGYFKNTAFHPLKNYVAAFYNIQDTDSNIPLLRIALWDLNSQKIIDLGGYTDLKKFYKYHTLAFSKNGRYLVALYGIAKNSSWNNNNPSRDWGVHVWDLKTLEHEDREIDNLFEIPNGDRQINNLKLSDNENYLIINHDVWHLPTRQKIEHRQEEKSTFEGIAFHPSKNYLAGRYYISDDSEKTLALWNLESNEIIHFKGSINPDLLGFSNDCHYLVETYYTRKKCPCMYSFYLESCNYVEKLISEVTSDLKIIRVPEEHYHASIYFLHWGLRIWNLQMLGQEHQNFDVLFDVSTDDIAAYGFKFSDNGAYFKTDHGDMWHIPTQQKVDNHQKRKIKKEFFSDDGYNRELPFSLTIENIKLYTTLLDNIVKKNDLSEGRHFSDLLDATSRAPDQDTFQLIDENRVLKTYRSEKRALETLLNNSSLETVITLVHLSHCNKEERCLSCKHLELPQEIEQLLLNNLAITKCDFCQKKRIATGT